MRPAARAWLATLALGLSTGTAAADERVSAVLVWEAPQGCLSEADLRRAVEARLGRTVFDAAAATLSVEGHVERSGDGWRAELILEGLGGEVIGRRTLERDAGDCAALDGMLPVVVAIFVDLTPAELSSLRQSVAPADEVQAEPRPGADPDPTPARARRRGFDAPPVPSPPRVREDHGADGEPSWHFAGGAAVTGALGLLPRPVAGLALFETVTPPGLWPLDFALVAWGEARSADGVGTFRLWTVRVGTCPLLASSGSVELSACGGLGTGALTASGEEVAISRRRVRPVGFVEGGLRVAFGLFGPLRARAELGLGVPFLRDRFVIQAGDGLAEVHRMAPVLVLASIGIAVATP